MSQLSAVPGLADPAISNRHQCVHMEIQECTLKYLFRKLLVPKFEKNIFFFFSLLASEVGSTQEKKRGSHCKRSGWE